MNELLREHPIFLCGNPRSGTSLLRALFDGHPQVIAYPYESFFFRGFLPQAAKRDIDGKVDLASRYLLQFMGLRREMVEDFENFHPNESTVHEFAEMCLSIQHQIVANGYRHDGDLLAAAVLAFGEVYGFVDENSRFWLEKSIYNEFFADQIYSWWPDARCIHLVRDPRDVFASYQPRRRNVLARKFSLRWARSVEKGLENQKVFGKDRYLLINYEQLVNDLEGTMHQLAEFLGITDHQILRVPSLMGEPWKANSTFSEKFSEISSKPIGRWKTEIPARDVQIIEQIAKKPMSDLGYPAETHWSLLTSLLILRGYLSFYRDALKNIDPIDIYGVE
ncbi:MAG: sulfotransferase [Anaerolineales bacterium]|nr:sulfotransferase [Chloroflexota bacterium]MBL6979876.1 sulfotransferase [Anaerolineales bacterium]